MSSRGTALVTGATGFVGRHLVPALIADGWRVRALTRHPERYDGPGEVVGGDVSQPASLDTALAGVDVAFYLVHSLDRADYVERDAQAARNFAAAAERAGVRQIVYLGGLGEDGADLSEHLRSRREVEHLLAGSTVPVTALRAAIIVGDGGISWEITRQLVKNLPAMVVPRWVTTRTQPIALADTVRYLVGVAGRSEAFGRTFEIGGADSLTYREMLQVAAEEIVGHRLPIIRVPVLTPRLSSYWLSLVTDIDVRTGRNLIDSLGTEVVVTDQSIRALVPGDPAPYVEAVRAALSQRLR